MAHRKVLFPQGDNPPQADLYYGQDVRETLRSLPEGSVQTVVTSPPYWALRDYQGEPTVWGGDKTCAHDWEGAQLEGSYCQKCGAWCGQLGLEPSPELYVAHMVEVFQEVRRVLRDDGTLWLNISDTYFAGGSTTTYGQDPRNFEHNSTLESKYTAGTHNRPVKPRKHTTLKAKDLVGIPWRVALALQEDGWWVRNDILWRKQNPLPSSVQDRMSCTYEHVFLLSKSAKYFFDLDAIRVPHTYGEYAEDGSFSPTQQWHEEEGVIRKMDQTEGQLGTLAGPPRRNNRGVFNPRGKNPGDVWDFPTHPFSGAHFAVMPPVLSERCLLAGSSEKGCCSECGAPYKRVITREKGSVDRPNHQYDPSRPEGMTLRGGRLKQGAVVDMRWDATCECDAPISRCTVLDPFSGSGTTGMVALRRGRHYLGIDLNESYLNMAEERVRGDSYTGERSKPPEGSVLDIF